MNESEIIKGVLNNDIKAQELLYKHYAPKMYALCLRYARHQMEAEDLLQDGFVKVFTHLKDYKNEGSFEGWIRRIFTNHAINVINKKQYKSEIYYSEPEFDHAIDEINIIQKISEQELLSIISTIPIGYRTIFNLYVIDGYNHSEISKMLDITESTSRSQLTKAKRFLRELLIKKQRNEQQRRIG